MAEIRITPAQFRRGVIADPAFEGAPGVAEELRNLLVDRNGRLIARSGSSRTLTTGAQGALFTALNRVYFNAASIGSRAHLLGILAAVPATKYCAITAFPFGGVWTDLLNKSTNPDSNPSAVLREFFYTKGVMFRGRWFWGVNLGCWVDISGAVPALYTLGAAAPTNPTCALVAGGDLTDATWYAFAYTYYNSSWGIETAPTAAVGILTAAPNLRVRVTLTRTVDEQFSQFRVYRTTGHATQALAEAAAFSLVGTVAHTAGVGTVTTEIDATTLDGGPYTLGPENATDDHDVLGTGWSFGAVHADRLWVAGGFASNSRRLAACKRTTTAVYPDAFPSEQVYEVGGAEESITGLESAPTGLLCFTNQSIYVIRGDTPTTIDLSTKIANVGCRFPRTIQRIGGLIYFMGSDNAIWVTDGASVRALSEPVNHYLKDIKPSWTWIPCAGVKGTDYWLSYPEGAITTSSAATTVTNPSPASGLITSTTRFRLTDNAAWDLSGVKIGMWVQVQGLEGSNAIISAVNDGSNFIDAEDWRAYSPTSGETFEVLANNRVLIYDSLNRLWTGPHRGVNANAFSWWSGEQDSGQFFVAKSDGGYVDQFGTGTTDVSGAITSLWRSHWFLWDEPVRITGVKVIQQGGAESSLTVNLYKDFGTSVDATTTFTPSLSNLRRAGIYGSSHQATQVEITGSGIGAIQEIRFEVER